MTDPVPDYSNRAAHFISILFHPFVVALPTLWVILYPVPHQEALAWLALILLIFIVPLAASLLILRRQAKYAYQRRTRFPIYLVGWTSIGLCLGLTIVLQAPTVLVACMAALALWIPLQFAINTLVTKISIHTAVITGCVVSLLFLGLLPTILLQALALLAVALTAWARIVTRHHTLQQVLLGIFTGSLPVLLIFPLILKT